MFSIWCKQLSVHPYLIFRIFSPLCDQRSRWIMDIIRPISRYNNSYSYLYHFHPIITIALISPLIVSATLSFSTVGFCKDLFHRSLCGNCPPGFLKFLGLSFATRMKIQLCTNTIRIFTWLLNWLHPNPSLSWSDQRILSVLQLCSKRLSFEFRFCFFNAPTIFLLRVIIDVASDAHYQFVPNLKLLLWVLISSCEAICFYDQNKLHIYLRNLGLSHFNV